MKRVLGLDLGSGDIGWGILDEYNGEIIDNAQPLRKDKIVAAGCRIVPLSADECNNFFSKGQALTKNATRTKNAHNAKVMTVINCAERCLLKSYGDWVCMGTLHCGSRN